MKFPLKYFVVVSSISQYLSFVLALPTFDYGNSQEQFMTDVIRRSSPDTARLLAELFGGLEVGLNIGNGAQAVISIGGAATTCQHQSPCYDAQCQLCYDPLLRIHGKCGGASYYTCRGTLPKGCLPFSCSTRAARTINPENLKTTVFVKKFPRFQDPFCLGKRERARSLGKEFNISESSSLTYHPRDVSRGRSNDVKDPDWVMSVPEAITPCQSYDMCLDLKCGHCYDPYLGIHTTCGKLTYYDCLDNLPKECRPMKCTDTNIKELFPPGSDNKKKRDLSVDVSVVEEDDENDLEESPLMVRNFPPPLDNYKNCI